MDEPELLKTRIRVTNEVVKELLQSNIENRIIIDGLENAIKILQGQLLEATKSSAPINEPTND